MSPIERVGGTTGARAAACGRPQRHNPCVATVRELEPAVIRAFSRSGDDLGLARLPWPNVGAGDVVELDSGDVVRVVDVVHALPGSIVGALVKVTPLP